MTRITFSEFIPNGVNTRENGTWNDQRHKGKGRRENKSVGLGKNLDFLLLHYSQEHHLKWLN